MTENEVLLERLEKIAELAGRRVRIGSSERRIAELEAELAHERALLAEAERTAYMIHRHYGPCDSRGREVVRWGHWFESYEAKAETYREAVERSLARRRAAGKETP